MERRFSAIVGIVLMLIGGVALAFTLVGGIFGFRVWQLWPIPVVLCGLAFVLPPLLVRDKPGLGALFVPGIPILLNGCLLLFASVFNYWRIWEWLWPQEVLAVAVGFALAALFMRNVWLLIPAIFVGANGLFLQFFAITGFWELWSVLWVIEPLSVGLALFAVNIKQRSPGLTVAAVAACALAGIGFLESVAIVLLSSLFSFWWVWRWIGPLSLVFVGLALLIWSAIRYTPASPAAAD